MTDVETPTDPFTQTVEETVTENLVEETQPDHPHSHPRTRQTITKTVRKSTFRNGRLVGRSTFKKTVVTNTARPLTTLADDLHELATTPDPIHASPVIHHGAHEQETDPSTNINPMPTSQPPNHDSEPNPPVTPTTPPTNSNSPTPPANGDAPQANPAPSARPPNTPPQNPTVTNSTPNTRSPHNHPTASEPAQNRPAPSQNPEQTSQQQPPPSEVRPNRPPSVGVDLTNRARRPYRQVPSSNHVQSLAQDTPGSSRSHRSYAAETRRRHIAALAAQSFRSRYEDEPVPPGIWWVTAHKQTDNFPRGSFRKKCQGFYATRREAIARTKELFEADIHQYSDPNPTEPVNLNPAFDARGCWQITYSGGFLYNRLMTSFLPETEGRWVIQVIGGNFGNPERNVMPKAPVSYWEGPFVTREQAVMEGKNQMARKSSLSFEKVAGDEEFYLQEDSDRRWSVLWSPLHLDYVKVIVTKLASQ